MWQRVYWTGLDDGTVMKLPSIGGVPLVLANAQNSPSRIAIDSTHVYWLNQASGEVLKSFK